MLIRRWLFLVVLVVSGVLAASCAPPVAQPGALAQEAVATATSAVATATPAVATSAQAATPTVQLSAPTQAATGTPTYPAPTPTPASGSLLKMNLDEIFPPGKGRELALQNCGECHAVVCITLGQLTVGYWENVAKHDHQDKVPDMSDEEYNAVFAYLEENFNDTKPEPKLPTWYHRRRKPCCTK